MKESELDVYIKSLLPKTNGYPLYKPSPPGNSVAPQEFHKVAVRIGDVGVLTYDGGFDFLYNACVPATHPLNADRQPPDGFEPMTFDPSQIRQDCEAYPPRSFVTSDVSMAGSYVESYPGILALLPERFSSFVRSLPWPFAQSAPDLDVAYNFRTNQYRDTVLILPEGAIREDYADPELFLEYALKNAESWYHHANKTMGRLLINGDSLYFITGRDKCKTWALGAQDTIAGASEWTANFVVAPAAHSTASHQRVWETGNGRPSWMKIGPPVEQGTIDSQAVFIRGLRIARWDQGAESTTVREDDEVTLICNHSPISPIYGPYHPSDYVNQFLLYNIPGAKKSFIHDDEWCEVLTKDAPLPQDYEILIRILDSYAPVLESGCVHLIRRQSASESSLSQFDWDKPVRLERIGRFSMKRYPHTKQHTDLDAAVLLTRMAVELTPSTHPEFKPRSSYAASCLKEALGHPPPNSIALQTLFERITFLIGETSKVEEEESVNRRQEAESHIHSLVSHLRDVSRVMPSDRIKEFKSRRQLLGEELARTASGSIALLEI
ncbi:hypothetical protein JAAARDRAFT_38141 [Jaapia argillacea MUCL 33604]|uniref:Uncharacterized protein n=1 Tax=Jaapia argillacea MUCL 33604 TaxID=933084 RepID=A0A067PVV9_9AGAM|nr:hypothetical protein JAAARDRAFT_38141 [Jaapia argillacea MUCL 33604]